MASFSDDDSAAEQARVVRLDGFHALKHAIRFNANIVSAHTDRLDATLELATSVAPDIGPWLQQNLVTVDAAAMRKLTDELHPTRVVSFVQTPVAGSIADEGQGRWVLLEDPRNLGNLGASIRVAAALNAAGLIVLGPSDPWAPAAIRGSAGLHFALPIVHLPTIDDFDTWRESRGAIVVGLDPEGTSIVDAAIGANVVLCFGTERDGLSDELLSRCSARLSLAMRAGVSSLNLATTVSAVLFYLNSR